MQASSRLLKNLSRTNDNLKPNRLSNNPPMSGDRQDRRFDQGLDLFSSRG
ncbi:MAG: hypothetical protein WAO55_16540 [Candidatus Manganitrophaceae bacterium]